MPIRPSGSSSRAQRTSGPKSKTKKSAPKSNKADGTPKKRWSAAERAAKGVAPRRGGGHREPRVYDSRAPRTDSSERSDSTDRYERPSRENGFNRDGRPPRENSFNRDDRPQRFSRDDRPARDTSFNRDDRPQRFNRDDRPARNSFNREDRPVRDSSFNRDDRPQRSNRDDRPARDNSFNRDDRPQRFNRDDRPARDNSFNRDDRPQRFNRDDRPARNSFNREDRPVRDNSFNRDDRPQRSNRDDRPARDTSFNRDDRPQRFNRDDRPARDTSFNRDDRPQRFNRDDRPARDNSFNRDDRPQRFNRDDRPARNDRFSRDDRPQRSFRDDRPARGDGEENPDQMSWTPTEITPLENAEEITTGFAELGVPAVLVNALASQGITTPFPIQTSTIPDALNGRDVLGRGQTGSGKTLGFGLPLLARLAGRKASSPRGLVMVPTRELALQVADVIAPLARTLGLSVTLIAGGMAYGPQIKALGNGVDIVVATPGRLIDLMDQGVADLTAVEVTVLDEADHMADLGFLPAVTTIMDTIPGDGQRMLFSATLDSGVGRIVRTYLHDAVTHEVDSSTASVTTMEHHVLLVQPNDKARLTAEIAGREGRSIVFVRTQRGADRVADQLRELGVMAGALHGGLTQGARARTLEAFKDGRVPVLVATDVAARGIHVDDVSLVLQADPPAGPKDYLHRAGRTARAGDKGVVVTFALPHQKRELTRLTRDAGVKAFPVDARPGDAELIAATGAQTPSNAAIATEDYQRLIAPKQQQRSHNRRGPGNRGQGGYQGGRGAAGRSYGPRGRRRDA